MRIAIIENGAVARVITGGSNWQDVFPGAEGIPSDTANVGDLWDGTAIVPPAPPPPTADDLRAFAAAKRFAVETGGIAFEGSTIATDRVSQQMISGAFSFTQTRPEETIAFKADTGWIDLDADQVAAIATAVAGHVQACFAAERAVDAEISNGTILTFEEVDAAAWPANG